MQNQKIRIRLKAFDYRLIDQSALKSSKPPSAPGPSFVARCRCRPRSSAFDVLRSPHVNKTSRDQFEIRTHLRLMDIIDPTDKTVDALMKLGFAGRCRRRDQVAVKQVKADIIRRFRRWPDRGPRLTCQISPANRNRLEENNHESRPCWAQGRHDAHFYR